MKKNSKATEKKCERKRRSSPERKQASTGWAFRACLCRLRSSLSSCDLNGFSDPYVLVSFEKHQARPRACMHARARACARARGRMRAYMHACAHTHRRRSSFHRAGHDVDHPQDSLPAVRNAPAQQRRNGATRDDPATRQNATVPHATPMQHATCTNVTRRRRCSCIRARSCICVCVCVCVCVCLCAHLYVHLNAVVPR